MKTKALTLALLGMITSHLAAQTFSDDTFEDSDWKALKIYDNTEAQVATFASSQSVLGGNPDSYRRTTHDYPVGGLIVAHLRRGATHDPATQGSITSLNVSYDLRSFQNGVSLAVASGPLLRQGTNYYLATYATVTANEWISFSWMNLTASDFNSVSSGGGHPDFSANGAPIQFGYTTANSTCCGIGHTESGIDNWSLTVVSAPSCPTLSIRVSQVELRWASQTNRLYQIQYRSELTTNEWADLGSPSLGTGTINFLYDGVLSGQPQRFYRIVCLSNEGVK